jgi:hypothetical protein
MTDARCGWCPTRRMGSRCLMTGHRCAVRSEPVVALARTVRVYSRSAVAEFARAAGADERSIDTSSRRPACCPKSAWPSCNGVSSRTRGDELDQSGPRSPDHHVAPDLCHCLVPGAAAPLVRGQQHMTKGMSRRRAAALRQKRRNQDANWQLAGSIPLETPVERKPYDTSNRPRVTPKASGARGWYASTEWKKRSRAHLEANPLCVVCGGRATVADHIEWAHPDDREAVLEGRSKACAGRTISRNRAMTGPGAQGGSQGRSSDAPRLIRARACPCQDSRGIPGASRDERAPSVCLTAACAEADAAARGPACDRPGHGGIHAAACQIRFPHRGYV